MDILWAPWRMNYISGLSKNEGECVFCTKPRDRSDKDALILLRGEKAYVIMNLYPYNNGHLLIVPYAHVATLCDVDQQTSLELWNLSKKALEALTKALKPDGYNMGINLGRVAGAGIEHHLHIHIVPRWNGDTNYLPVVGQTKVISQSLEECYNCLLPFFKKDSS